jgi:F0F1-type ATP synthase membrane subunit b/b'
MPRPHHNEPPHIGRDVSTLLETERRLELRLAEARQEAQRIVDEARREASAPTPSLADELARRGANASASRRHEET